MIREDMYIWSEVLFLFIHIHYFKYLIGLVAHAAKWMWIKRENEHSLHKFVPKELKNSHFKT